MTWNVWGFIFFFNFCLARHPQWAWAFSFTRFLHHTQWRTTVGRTPLDGWSARFRDLYLTTHNTHYRQTSMPRWNSNTQFEHTIRTHNPSMRAAAKLRFTPRGHWGRLLSFHALHISVRCNLSPLVNVLYKPTECIPTSETVELNFRRFTIKQIFYVAKEILQKTKSLLEFTKLRNAKQYETESTNY